MKDVEFHGSSLDDLKSFPDEMRREAGHQISRVQNGLMPADWKTVTTVGNGVKEIRIRDEDGAFRIIYVSEYKGLVHVLHAFQKKDNKTRKADIDKAKRRYRAMKNG